MLIRIILPMVFLLLLLTVLCYVKSQWYVSVWGYPGRESGKTLERSLINRNHTNNMRNRLERKRTEEAMRKVEKMFNLLLLGSIYKGNNNHLKR